MTSAAAVQFFVAYDATKRADMQTSDCLAGKQQELMNKTCQRKVSGSALCFTLELIMVKKSIKISQAYKYGCFWTDNWE